MNQWQIVAFLIGLCGGVISSSVIWRQHARLADTETRVAQATIRAQESELAELRGLLKWYGQICVICDPTEVQE